jgi:dihydrofolate reductase
MRKLIYVINLSLDGCCDHTKMTPDEKIFDFHINLMQNVGVLIYGRITFELMVPYWPDIIKNSSRESQADVAFAKAFDDVPKVVFSKTLDKVDDKNSRIARSSPEDEINKLKQEPGKDIYVGGVAFPAYLMERGLIDEFIFVVQPVLVGEGRHLELKGKSPLTLVDTKVFKSGSMVFHYKK